MKIFVIANISNGKDTIGLRLLDTDSKQVQDVPVNNIKDVLKT